MTTAATTAERTQDRELRTQGLDTLDRLLQAGADIFGEMGYHALTVDDVARRADTSRGTFYLYFSNKDDLLRVLAETVTVDAEKVLDAMPVITRDAQGSENLRAWLSEFTTFYLKYGGVIRAWQEAQNTLQFAEFGVHVLTDFMQKLNTAISGGLSNRAANPDIAAMALIAMLERFNFLLASGMVKVDSDEMLDTLTAVIHRGFFGAD